MKGREVDTHPSFGIIRFSRRSGKTGPMFGSSIETHAGTVDLKICRAERHHSLNEDSYYEREVLAAVEMTSGQFAQLITTLNHGSGTPCTISWMSPDGRVEPPPADLLRTESHKILSDFVDGVKEPNAQVISSVNEVINIIEASKIGKKDKEQVLRILRSTKTNLSANQTFIVDQIKEATDRAITAAKTEVDSFITAVISNTGLTAIKDQFHQFKQIKEGSDHLLDDLDDEGL